MQQLRILYLDAKRDKALQRALSKYGTVSYAQDLNSALFLMADNDFDYYFIDADVPESQAFLKHLRHDPQLTTPRGVVLLTMNDEEDCEAWAVDTFLSRDNAIDDISYVFSHLKGDRCESATVLRIASFNPEGPVRQLDSVSEHSKPTIAASEPADPEETDAREHLNLRHRKEFNGADTDATVNSAQPSNKARNMRLTLVGALLVVLGVWLFVAGPLSTKASKSKSKESTRKRVNAEAQRESKADQKYESSAPGSTPATTTTAPAPAPSPVEASSVAPTDTSEQPAPTTPPPAQPAVNHPPGVSIAGPTQVMRGQSANYSASGSDPDGDSVSFSWTSRTMCWSTPGLYSVSVTVTDSKGATGANSISVRVI